MNPPSGQRSALESKETLSPLKDEDLVALARKSDQRAIEDLVYRYQQKAYAIAYHFTDGNVQDAEDLTQEAFLRTFQNT